MSNVQHPAIAYSRLLQSTLELVDENLVDILWTWLTADREFSSEPTAPTFEAVRWRRDANAPMHIYFHRDGFCCEVLATCVARVTPLF